MDVKVRTAALSTGMNILLTCLKFLLFFLSGSLAVLAEAWHSLTDIATSLLVLFGVKRSSRREEAAAGEAEEDARPGRSVSRLELAVSLCIGLLLLVVALLLLRRFVTAESRPIDKALVSGLLFIGFSLGSYFVSLFEIRVGKREGSVGLIADGMHARADMVASLLAGFSLILYSIGLDLDPWVAGLIALFILSFSLETVFNVVRVIRRRDEDDLFRHRSYQILAAALDGQALRAAADRLRAWLEQRLGPTRLARDVYRFCLALPFVVIGGAYLSTGLFAVGAGEQAVVERFGRPLSLVEPVGPGLHIKLPWPVDRARKVKTRAIRELNIGNVTDRGMLALLWTRKHGSEEPFLSGDNNFFYPYIVLHYRVRDPFAFLYRNADPEALIDHVAHRVATNLFARQGYYEIAASHRGRLEERMTRRIQEALDGLGSGVEVVSVNFKDIHPPIPVADAFERVIAGFQQKQRIINEAWGYRNKVIPEARGTASQRLEEAEGYILDRRMRAEGDASRFLRSLPRSSRAREITRSRIRLRTAQEILEGKTMIVVDPNAGIPELWMDFENIFPTNWLGEP